MEPEYAEELRRLTGTRDFREKLRGLLREAFGYEPRSLEEAPPESLALLYCWAMVELGRRKVHRRRGKP
ncbi:MAG: hypothetical protein QXD04_04390 [Candidatus Bathyarchaeia archaeon]